MNHVKKALGTYVVSRTGLALAQVRVLFYLHWGMGRRQGRGVGVRKGVECATLIKIRTRFGRRGGGGSVVDHDDGGRTKSCLILFGIKCLVIIRSS